MNDRNKEFVISEITDILRPVLKSSTEECVSLLLDRYQNIESVFYANPEELREIVGQKAACYINLLARITSRRLTENFEFGKKYTESELTEYLKALFIGLSVEHLYLVSFSDSGEILAVDLISVGTVNSAVVIPRNIIETALKRRAKSIMLAHNHPMGKPEPSSEDNDVVSSIKMVASKSGIRFVGHIIIAGKRHLLTLLSTDEEG